MILDEASTGLMDRAEVIRERNALIALLTDALDSAASVGFLPPLQMQAARDYWIGVEQAIEAGERKLIALRTAGVLAGTVQLQRAGMPNGRHRGEVMKLMVHRTFRGRGYARILMAAMEAEARRQGLELLVLDTRHGDAAERLYRSLGWQDAGVIPGYARGADGELHSTVFFYKQLTKTT
jgi:ribosomal protein S18 acetylase RimI-like enzyme